MKVQVVACWVASAVIAAPAFEVASIRPASLPTPDTFRSGQFRPGLRLDAGSLDWQFASLADLLPYAFGVKTYQVAGPDWMRESRWNIQAKLPQGASENQAPEMVQALLRDRFKLAYHHERREQPVYELTVGKDGPKMQVVEAVAPPRSSNNSAEGFGPFGGGPFGRGPDGRGPGGRGPGDGGPGDASRAQQPDGPGGRGGFAITGANGTSARISPDDSCGMHLELDKITMQDLADTLSPFLDRPVLDSTGLKSSFKISLNLPMEVLIGMIQNQIRTAGLPFGGPGGPGGFGGRGPGDGPGGRGLPPGCPDPATLFSGAADASNAPIFQAVQKLGLKLQAKKAPFDTIVVDHLEKEPTEN
jgi:uncharacterized protein (TIGR03435 family)